MNKKYEKYWNVIIWVIHGEATPEQMKMVRLWREADLIGFTCKVINRSGKNRILYSSKEKPSGRLQLPNGNQLIISLLI